MLALSGSEAFERKDYRKAIGYWEQLLKSPELGEPMKQAIAGGIERARVAAQAASTKPAAQDAGGKQAAQSTSPSPATSGATSTLSGTVRLDRSLSAKVAPEDTVFVFARAEQGPRMPLAIVRIVARDLPYRFKLDDSMAMAPQMKLSGFARVVVGARISRSGTATPSPGDLEGMSAAVAPNAAGVNVVIDRTLN